MDYIFDGNCNKNYYIQEVTMQVVWQK